MSAWNLSHASQNLFNLRRLTYMATLEQLKAKGKIEEYLAELPPGQAPGRYVYASTTAVAWFSNELANAPLGRGRDLTPEEQVHNRLHEFITDDPLNYNTTHRDLDQYVWEIKTADVRLLGWFPRKSTFFIVLGEFKDKLLRAKFYRPYIQTVVEFRANLCLDDPKFLMGGTRDVL